MFVNKSIHLQELIQCYLNWRKAHVILAIFAVLAKQREVYKLFRVSQLPERKGNNSDVWNSLTPVLLLETGEALCQKFAKAQLIHDNEDGFLNRGNDP